MILAVAIRERRNDMARGQICERCKREVWVSFRCEVCHRGVCRDCITFKDKKQLCLDCADHLAGTQDVSSQDE